MVAAAEDESRQAKVQVAEVVSVVAKLLENGFDELDAVVDVWMTLRSGEARMASYLGATAIVRLAQAERDARRTNDRPHQISSSTVDTHRVEG